MTKDNINPLTHGIDKDTAPIKQKEEVVNFVLNGIYNAFDGEFGSIQNEPGNEECWSLPDGFNMIGHINMGNDETLIFAVNNASGFSTLGVASKGCKYEEVLRTRCLGFDECNMIKGKYRNIRGCGRTVYFYDGKNYDKAINIDDLEKYTQTYEETDALTGKVNLVHYTVEQANGDDLWDCNEMKLEPDYLQPCIADAVVNNSGGQIELGMWKFAVELLDSDRNSIGFGPISQGIQIYTANTDSSEYEIQGGHNIDTYDPEIGGQLITNKSITLNLGNLDTRFRYARVYAIPARTGDGVTLEVIVKGDLIPIAEKEQTYTFLGFDESNGDFMSTLDEVTAIKNRYISSNVMEIVDKRLVRYNLTQAITDWSDFQRAVSKIGTEFVWKEVFRGNAKLGDPDNPLTTFKRMSEMGDEITAWALVYHFKQGFDSPAFHIPGRCKLAHDEALVSTGTEEVTIQYDIHDIRKVFNPDGSIDVQISYDFLTALQNPSFCFNMLANPNENPSGQFDEQTGYMTFHYPPGTLDDDHTWLIIKTNEGNVNGDEVTIPITFNNVTSTLATADPVIGSFTISQIITTGGTESWEVSNTAQITGDMKGIMGYHECKQGCYPAIYDCEGKSVWGVDACGKELINTPIRHHRLPDRSLVPHFDYDTNTLRPLGLLFSNITYPHPDIIGHSFVRVNRTEASKTVLAAGHIAGTCEIDDKAIVTSMDIPVPTKNHEYLSPDIKVKSRVANGQFLKYNHVVNYDKVHQTQSQTYNEAGRTWNADDVFIGNRIFRGQSITPIAVETVDLEDNKLVNALAKSTGQKEVVNLLWDNKVNYLRTEEDAPRGYQELVYSTIKREADPYCNLDSLIYYRTHSCPFFGAQGSFEVFGGDTFICKSDIIRSYLSDVEPSQTNNIWAIIGVVITAALAVVTYGASLIATAAIIAAAGIIAITAAGVIADLFEGRYAACSKDPFINENEGPFGDGFLLFISELIDNIYAESEVNFNLRHTGTIEEAAQFDDFKTTGNNYIEDLERYYENKYVVPCEDGDDCSEKTSKNRGFKLRDIMLPEIYWVNRDYDLHKALGENKHISLSQTHDYCDDCGDREPNAAIWSERAFDEETADGWKIYRPLNKINIGNHAGEITNVKYDKNRMLILTKNSSFHMSPNPRELQSSEETIYTGIGDFLSIPEQEYIKVEWGYGGNQGKFNAVLSEYGWTYADQQNGEVFNYTSQGLQPINKGLTNWFKEELPSKLLCLLKEHNIEHTCKDSTTAFNGLGLQAVFDPRYKRYILHKTDFLPINFNGKYNDQGNNRPGFYYFPARNVWISVEDNLTENFIPLGDPKFFTNESWTISYSYLHQAWISYHSYQPSYMFNDADTFYTFNFNEQSWEHIDRNFTTYYGDKYDFIVDYTVNNLPTDDLHALHWYSRSKAWDVSNKRWIDVANKTFDKMLVYNSNQSTGDQKLIYLDKEANPFGNRIGWSNTEKDVILTEKDYKVSAIRDLSIDQPSITSNFQALADQFNLSDSQRQGYIDCVTFTDNVDYNKSEYNLADMKDKYHLIRLYFTKENTEDIKIILDLINSKTFISTH